MFQYLLLEICSHRTFDLHFCSLHFNPQNRSQLRRKSIQEMAKTPHHGKCFHWLFQGITWKLEDKIILSIHGRSTSSHPRSFQWRTVCFRKQAELSSRITSICLITITNKVGVWKLTVGWRILSSYWNSVRQKPRWRKLLHQENHFPHLKKGL